MGKHYFREGKTTLTTVLASLTTKVENLMEFSFHTWQRPLLTHVTPQLQSRCVVWIVPTGCATLHLTFPRAPQSHLKSFTPMEKYHFSKLQFDFCECPAFRYVESIKWNFNSQRQGNFGSKQTGFFKEPKVVGVVIVNERGFFFFFHNPKEVLPENLGLGP